MVEAVILKLTEPKRKEQGWIYYDIYQNNENKNLFLVYEIWESRELWQTLMKNTHLAEYNEGNRRRSGRIYFA